jgi:hypothetical protein
VDKLTGDQIDELARRICDAKAAASDSPLRSWFYISKNGVIAESWRAAARAAVIWIDDERSGKHAAKVES